MRKIFIFKRKRSTVSLIHVFCILLIFFLSGCGGGGDDNLSVSPGTASDGSSGTGSAVFTVAWHDYSVIENSENSLITAQEESAPLRCEDVGVKKIICEVYEVKDDSSTFLTSGGPWDCSLHSESINGIVAGTDRKFVLLGISYGEDNKENILYHGEVSGVTITGGQINDAGTIEVFPFFIDELLSPPYGSSVPSDQLSLNWTPVKNAYEYRVQVSKDIDFTPPLSIDETTIGPPYNPSGLSVGQTYYWKVVPCDFYANQGAESTEVWSFTIIPSGPCTYSISPMSRSFSFIGGRGTVSVTAPKGCGWTVKENVNWISIRSGSSGSGDGTVSYSVSTNFKRNSRNATITVAGKEHMVTQDGIN